ncbi:YnbE family lipoprotein [Pseudoalteromonas xiamenensis]|uniref:YnbE family lipoprotein n=1 Tax=Pseudoalteromonas xiamenensis TaxID=882626 RepID=UPI0027E5220E|nr:YnbE family lipoprotein [Pseudoalteromonas xiamenensis]WMN59689.1 YnbE family lipoprotein [Pseudoalteromonas xiamenensis]
MKQLLLSLLAASALAGCTHRIEVAAKEPITINMNLKIDHEIRVKVDKELDTLFEENESLF